MHTASSSGHAPVNGIQMYYEVYGSNSRPPLVLIHGGGSTITTTFGTILPMLSPHFYIIAVEMQAHGHTSDRDAAESFVQDAADVAALLAWLKVSKASFLGFSNGGQTAMQIALSYPALVHKLGLASVFYSRAGAFEGFFDMLQNGSLKDMPQPLQQAYLAIPGNTKEGLQNMHDKDRNRMLAFKGWSDEEIKHIAAPTLLINGNHDVGLPAHAIAMAQLMPNANLLIVPGNHGSYIGEACTLVPGSSMPAAIVEIIKEFLLK